MRFEDIGKPLSGIPTSNEQNELARHPPPAQAESEPRGPLQR